MAVLHPIGYPYYVNITPGTYTIYDNNKIIYYGDAYDPLDTGTIRMNISSILQHNINVTNYDKHFINSKTLTTNTTHYIKLINNDTTITGRFIWDYSGKDGSDITTNTVISDYPTPWVYTGQMIPVTMYTPISAVYTFSIKTEEYSQIISNFLIENLQEIDVSTMSFYLNTSFSNDNYNIIMSDSSDFGLNIKSCMSDNTYTLYYINLKGALSYVHCTGKNTTKYNITRNQYSKNVEYDTPYINSSANYLTTKYRTWTLNTPILDDDCSKMLMDLFVSPRVLLYDYSDKNFISVNITDNSVEEKNRLNNHMYNYTINIQETQKYNIFQ